MPTTARTLLLSAAACAAFGVTAAPAGAASIAYVKDGSVWLSTPDGARQYQVTNGGGYSTVSQADDGRMVALHGDKIAFLDRQGNVLADIATPVSTGGDPTFQFKGPFDPVISPDGSKVAYTYYWQYIGQDPYCNPSTYCYTKRLYQGIAFTAPDRLTAWDEPGMRRQSGWIHPFWVGSDRVFATDPAIAPNEDMVMVEPGKDKDLGFTRWFSQPNAKGWADSDMTRSQKKLAGVTGENEDHIFFAYVNGLPENGGDAHYPTQCPYELTQPVGGKFFEVSWSPDGGTLAYADGAGINTIPIPEFGATFGDCGNPAEDSKVVVPGGISPSFGPADVPPARAFPPAGGPPAPSPTPGAGGSAGPGGSGSGSGSGEASPIGVGGSGAAKLTLSKALSKGVPLTVSVSGAGTLTVTAKAKGKVVATGRAKPKKAGTAKLRLTFSKAGKRALARSKKATLTITATLKPKKGKKTTTKSKLTLKR